MGLFDHKYQVVSGIVGPHLHGSFIEGDALRLLCVDESEITRILNLGSMVLVYEPVVEEVEVPLEPVVEEVEVPLEPVVEVSTPKPTLVSTPKPAPAT
jgi:hypothetical protein